MADKVVFIDNKFSKKNVLYRRKNVVYCFVEAILNEMNYCQKLIKGQFKKNLIMSVEEEETFQLTNSCWVCDKLFDLGDDKARDHCHITGKYKGAVHWSCNINLK